MKKLSLNKETVTSLNNQEMGSIKGGGETFFYEVMTSWWWPCDDRGGDGGGGATGGCPQDTNDLCNP